MIFDKQGKVIESGLIAYSGLCNGIGNRINIQDFGSYITWSFKSEDDDLIRISCGITSDLASAFGEGLSPYLN